MELLSLSLSLSLKAGIALRAWFAQSWRTRFASPQTPLFIKLKIRLRIKIPIFMFTIKTK